MGKHRSDRLAGMEETTATNATLFRCPKCHTVSLAAPKCNRCGGQLEPVDVEKIRKAAMTAVERARDHKKEEK